MWVALPKERAVGQQRRAHTVQCCVGAALPGSRASGCAGIALGLGLPETAFEAAGTSAETSYWVCPRSGAPGSLLPCAALQGACAACAALQGAAPRLPGRVGLP